MDVPGIVKHALYAGMDVCEHPMLFSTSSKQKRRHRTKRIRRKWLKRYGLDVKWEYKAIVASGTLYIHPKLWAYVKANIETIRRELWSKNEKDM